MKGLGPEPRNGSITGSREHPAETIVHSSREASVRVGFPGLLDQSGLGSIPHSWAGGLDGYASELTA